MFVYSYMLNKVYVLQLYYFFGINMVNHFMFYAIISRKERNMDFIYELIAIWLKDAAVQAANSPSSHGTFQEEMPEVVKQLKR